MEHTASGDDLTLDDVRARHPEWDSIDRAPHGYEAFRQGSPHVQRVIWAETLAELDGKLDAARRSR